MCGSRPLPLAVTASAGTAGSAGVAADRHELADAVVARRAGRTATAHTFVGGDERSRRGQHAR